MTPTPPVANPNKDWQQNVGAPVATPISVSDISTPVQPLQITPQTDVPVPDVASIEVSQPQQQAGMGDSFTSRLSSLTGTLEGKDATKAASVDAATNPYVKELNQLNTQIKLNNAKAIQNQERAADMGETLPFASGEQQKIARTDAIEGLKLAAFAEAAQGNIVIAQAHAEKAADAYFAQVESNIKTVRANLINNFESFTPDQKKRATEALLRYNEEDKFVSARKEEMKAGMAIMANAAKNFPNDPKAQMAINQARKLDPSSETYLIDVNSVLAPYLKDPAAVQAAVDDHEYKKAQTSLAYANVKKLEAETGKTTAEALAAGPQGRRSDLLGAYSLATDILNSNNIPWITKGSTLNPFTYMSGNISYTANQAKQLSGFLALDNRTKLKGSGAVSDFEAKTLAQAASSLGIADGSGWFDVGGRSNLDSLSFKRELKKVAGVMLTATGQATTVRVTDPNTGQSSLISANREGIDNAIADGLTVEYQ